MKLRHITIILLLSGSIALLLHGILGSLSRYMGDDFCTAFYARRLGVLRGSWFWYLNWSGRFSASLLDGIIGRLGPEALPAVVPLTILLWVSILTLFFWTFLRPFENRLLNALTLAVTTLFALFLLTPDVRQSLYWGQGMRSVVSPLLLLGIQMILLDRVHTAAWNGSRAVFWGMLSFSLALWSGGFSETYASWQFAALTLALVIVLAIEKRWRSPISFFLGTGLLGALCALAIIFLAPGNAERQVFFPPPPGIADLLRISARGFWMYVAGLASSPEKILAIAGILGLGALLGSQSKSAADSRLRFGIPIIMLGLVFVCFLPAAYGTSDAPPGRTLLLPTYFLLLGLLAWGFVFGTALARRQDSRIKRLLPALVVISIAVSAALHSMDLYRSRPEFVEYAASWDRTHTAILSAKEHGAAQVLVPATRNWAGINTPTDNPRFWVNECMSSYYGVQILAEPDNVSTP
jgi:hypothetical protein